MIADHPSDTRRAAGRTINSRNPIGGESSSLERRRHIARDGRTALRGGLPLLVLAVLFTQVSPALVASDSGQKPIVVTSSILGAVVRDLVEDKATVIDSMSNGQDPHEWEALAKDIETINNTSLIVQNALGLEGDGKDPATG